MSFKMLVIAGHGQNMDGSFDPGAIGNGYREADLTRELARLIKEEADRQHIDCDLAPDVNFYSYLRNGGVYDFRKYQYVLEVHFNAAVEIDEIGDGQIKGSMIYIDQSETGHTVEDAILTCLYAIGSRQAWDGVVITQVQWPNGLLIQNYVRSQGVSHALLETCFVSDKDDMDWYQRKKREIAKAVVDGVRLGFGLGDVFLPYMVHVPIEDLNIRTAPTVDAPIVGVTGIGSFTIVEEAIGKANWVTGEKGLWGRLKSGAGWICLAFTEPVQA